MTFTDKQRRSLSAKLSHRHVKTRQSQGATLSYLEGWHVIAEANRIFGHGGWDRQTLYPRCIWSQRQAGQTAVLYSTKVRIAVRAGEDLVTRDGIGMGFGRAPSEEAAHEIAIKAAETDATKRALSTFGNPFGLALYDKDQAGVSRPPKPRTNGPKLDFFVLCQSDGGQVSFKTPQAFADAAFGEIRKLNRTEDLKAFVKRNRSTIAQLRSMGKGTEVLANAIRLVLYAQANALSQRDKTVAQASDEKEPAALPLAGGQPAFPKQRRVRNKEHLQFVARQPCLTCGRQPSHAHHVRFAQRRALGMKVSDEFTVPLCSAHHDAVHRTGDERRWWAQHGIDPLKKAAELWANTLGGRLGDVPASASVPDGNTPHVRESTQND